MLLLTTTCGPLGLSAAIGITSTESSSISQQITDHLLQADSIKQAKYNALFDHILCLTGNEKIVFPGKLQRVVPSSPSSELFNLAGYAVFIYRLITWNSIKLLPIIGGPWLAYRSLIHDGNERLKRLHRLQRLRGRQIEYYYMKEREGELVSMGIVMWILEGIPVIGSLFEFTDRVGIAYKCGTELSSIT
ncbi:DEKNAAC103300 [Brettanomyces naardenensis]|uniref:DEKNAAC103300 n=1 Tax=Brettanomyces naardenensis TaxID=13370 RepID=A0A448YMU6_BRENA|nr:DEKNAAC103300 [Brettanomyces naardenensis]